MEDEGEGFVLLLDGVDVGKWLDAENLVVVSGEGAEDLEGHYHGRDAVEVRP